MEHRIRSYQENIQIHFLRKLASIVRDREYVKLANTHNRLAAMVKIERPAIPKQEFNPSNQILTRKNRVQGLKDDQQNLHTGAKNSYKSLKTNQTENSLTHDPKCKIDEDCAHPQYEKNIPDVSF